MPNRRKNTPPVPKVPLETLVAGQYDILGIVGKRVDDLIKRVGELEQANESARFCISLLNETNRNILERLEKAESLVKSIDNLLMNPTGNMQGRLDTVENRVKALEKGVASIPLHIPDGKEYALISKCGKWHWAELEEASKPRWYVRAWRGIVAVWKWFTAPYKPSEWRKDFFKNYNTTHPMPRGKPPTWEDASGGAK